MGDSDFAQGRLCGSSEQLFGIRPYRCIGGKSHDVFCIDLYNNAGLQVTVVPDRGMDMLALRYHGTNISFLSKTGLVAPQFFVENGSTGFMDGFFAGFLTTGGLSYMGRPGEGRGLHGTISNTPAEQVCAMQTEEDLVVTGIVREARVFGPNLVLRRTVSMRKESARMRIKDQVTNLGYTDNSLMMLYHMNYGYPFMSQDLRINLPPARTFERDGIEIDHADSGLRTVARPVDGGIERVVFHRLTGDSGTGYVLENSKLGIRLRVRFSARELPYLNEWQSFVSGDYVLGLEPATNNVNGYDEAREHGELQYLAPGEIRTFDIDVELSTMEA